MAGKPGRPKIVWDEKQYRQFESLCAMQATVHEIEDVLQIDHKTINRLCKEYYHLDYSQAYKKYSLTGRISLRRMQFKLAEKSPAMAIFLGKNYLGQTDNPESKIADEAEEVRIIRSEDGGIFAEDGVTNEKPDNMQGVL